MGLTVFMVAALWTWPLGWVPGSWGRCEVQGSVQDWECHVRFGANRRKTYPAPSNFQD